MTPGFQQIIEEARAAGLTVKPYGGSSVIVLSLRDRRYKGRDFSGYRVAVILWESGWAQDARVDLSIARMVRNLRDVRSMLGLA